MLPTLSNCFASYSPYPRPKRSLSNKASTKDISQAVNPETYEDSKTVARQGGNVAKVALKELESKTGKKVVSSLNAKTVLGIEKPQKKKEEQ